MTTDTEDLETVRSAYLDRTLTHGNAQTDLEAEQVLTAVGNSPERAARALRTLEPHGHQLARGLVRRLTSIAKGDGDTRGGFTPDEQEQAKEDGMSQEQREALRAASVATTEAAAAEASQVAQDVRDADPAAPPTQTDGSFAEQGAAATDDLTSDDEPPALATTGGTVPMVAGRTEGGTPTRKRRAPAKRTGTGS